jgi:hypothetical protein
LCRELAGFIALRVHCVCLTIALLKLSGTHHKMKVLLKLLPILLLSSCATESEEKVSTRGIVAGISAPQTLQMMGDSYEARYSAIGSSKAIVEYYRSGEGADSWKRMLALRLNVGGPSSFQQVERMEQSIREGGSKAVRVYKDRDTDGYGIEFIVTTRTYQELDVFRYVDRTNAPGTVSFQYAEIIPFKRLDMVESSQLDDYYRSLRLKAVKAMEATPMPGIATLP